MTRQAEDGRKERDDRPPYIYPGYKSTRLRGPTQPAVPPFVGLAPDAGHRPYGSPGLPGFLGQAHAAFRPAGEVGKDMVLQGIAVDRLRDRWSLRSAFDRFRRDVDLSG